MDQDIIEITIPGSQNVVSAWIVAATLLLILLGFSAVDRLVQDEPQATTLPQSVAATGHLEAARKSLEESSAPLHYAAGSQTTKAVGGIKLVPGTAHQASQR